MKSSMINSTDRPGALPSPSALWAEGLGRARHLDATQPYRIQCPNGTGVLRKAEVRLSSIEVTRSVCRGQFLSRGTALASLRSHA